MRSKRWAALPVLLILALAAPAVVLADAAHPPVVVTTVPAANANGWYNANVVIGLDCRLATGSTRTGITTGPRPASMTASSEGSNVSVTSTGACVDSDGTPASATTVSGLKIDKMAPTLQRTIPAANAAGWHDGD